jgi:hypothetical protein
VEMGRKIEWRFANFFSEFSPITVREYIQKSRHRGEKNLHDLKIIAVRTCVSEKGNEARGTESH